MTSLPEAICPLCSQVFPSQRLHEHIAAEHPRLRNTTTKVIQAYHPSWLTEHGACEGCWKSFRDAGRILTMLKGAKAQSQLDPWELAAEAIEEQDPVDPETSHVE